MLHALSTLLQPIERAFDNSAVCFYLDSASGQLKLHVVWDDLRNKRLCESQWIGGEADRVTLHSVFNDITYGSLEGMPLLHTSKVSPFHRVLNAHAQLAILRAKEWQKAAGDWSFKPYGSEDNVISWLEATELGAEMLPPGHSIPSSSHSYQS